MKRICIISTIIICLFIIAFIAVPHHAITEKQAIDLAVDYYQFRADSDEIPEQIKISKRYKKYKPDKKPEEYKFSLLETIIDYWNPDLIFYRVFIKYSETSVDIEVDTYSGYVQDGMEDGMYQWIKSRKEYDEYHER